MATNNDLFSLKDKVSLLQKQITSVRTNKANQDQGNNSNGPPKYVIGSSNEQSPLRSRNNHNRQPTSSLVIYGVTTSKISQ